MDIGMRGKVSKKVTRKAKWMLNAYLKEISKWCFTDRLTFAWKVIKGDLWR
jgi:hypothetical protein